MWPFCGPRTVCYAKLGNFGLIGPVQRPADKKLKMINKITKLGHADANTLRLLIQNMTY